MSNQKRARSSSLSLSSRRGSPEIEESEAKGNEFRVHFANSNQAYSQPQYSQADSRLEVDQEEEEEGEEEDEDIEAETQNYFDRVVAMHANRGKLGCCYYDGESGKLYLMEDAEDSNYSLVTAVIEQIQPHLVFTSVSGESTFLESVLAVLKSTPSAASTSSRSVSETDEVRLEYRPARDFFAIAGKNMLANLRVVEGVNYHDGLVEGIRDYNGAEDDRSRRNAELRLGSFLNLESNPLTLGCAGAILGYISRTMSSNGELNVEANMVVQGLQLLSLEKQMIINSDALVSLQIFESESHASIHSNQMKEGLSLYGIMNVTRTPLGRALMKNWFTRPCLDIEIIESRQETVACFLRGENQHVMETIQSNFKFIKNVPRFMKVLASGKGGMKDWETVWNFFYGAIIIQQALVKLNARKDVEIVDTILDCVGNADFQEMGTTINDVIDWEESRLSSRVCVKQGVNDDLDQLVRKYHGLSDFLSQVATEIGQSLSLDITPTISVVYLPQLGYLIVIPTLETEPALEIGGFDFQFKTEASAYYKDDKCRDLDLHMGDLYSWITDKQIEIIHALLGRLLLHEKDILICSEALSKLDCLIAFAEVARTYEWSRPILTEENVYQVQGGRHPLVEIVVDSYVKSNVTLVGGKGVDWEADSGAEDSIDKSILIITGANYSGKSILLKQIALITYMAHLGSFVPAEYALIGLTDKILTRVSTRESITRGSSAFMIDLQQISLALRNLTDRSLLIIDEFGKGTSNSDGAGLFAGVIENLLQRGAECPRVAVATHFQDLIANGLITHSDQLNLSHMEIHLRRSSEISSISSGIGSVTSFDEITYLYQLKDSLATSSHATACAAMYNVSMPILIRAEEVSNLLARFEIDQLFNEGLDADEVRELAESEKIVRSFIALNLDEMVGEEFEEMLETLQNIVQV